ncbi:MAG: class I tRNA ligase family protein [Candidatus Taylorbacteria bacterium]|nr:class I tRNA ligase family protein [Candidatus Taylorbacteria bacterium]
MADSQETKPKSKLAQSEERILGFWKERDIFKKTLEKPAPKGEFVFYEGPPTANGRPGIHHVEARAFKDAIPRYKTMRGFRVRRKGGWDTHGLPVELEVEKAHGFKSKKEIEAYGVGKFNKECRESVWKYMDEWGRFTDRIGYWVDQESPYVTYESSYIESLWWIMGKIHEKGLFYKDYRVVPWCPRCGTALSSHELAQGYADIKELSVYVAFKAIGEKEEYFLAWTTTPWTLPGNVALAVGEDIAYARVSCEGKTYILAQERVATVFAGKEHSLDSVIKGKELVGSSYEPLYTYLRDGLSRGEAKKAGNAFKVYAADFVTTTDGTGIVHIAPMYGADDFALGTKAGLPKRHLVNDSGHFIEGTEFLEGRFVKDEETAVEIVKDLARKGLLFKKEKHEHTYPHCWRCKTPLIYFARDSWYIRMSEVRDSLIKENEGINWEPSHIKDGRFGEWLRDLKDWAISRERYWGTPLPIWQSEDGSETMVVDSVATLKKRAKKARNRYMLLRHGESESNVMGISNFRELDKYHLTKNGREQVMKRVKELREWGVDVIVASDFLRTKETARIIAEMVGIDSNEIVYDKRLREYNVGEEREGKLWKETETLVRRGVKFSGAENPAQVKKRAFEALAHIERAYEGKNVLIVSHGAVLNTLYNGIEADPSINRLFHDSRRHFQKTAEMHAFDYVPLPHDEEFALDLHKPYIDDIVLISDSGKELRRIKEVMDVWFDSGAMPFAQDHFPFDEKFKGFWGKKKLPYPADFISEAIDQTRGWFYTLHAIGGLLGKGKAYKNVICLGHILDKDGKKMSKSVGNVVNPWDMIEKYGADALRFWMYSVNQPGDSKNFDEKTVDEIVKRLFNMLSNVYTFYEIYAEKGESAAPKGDSRNVLDKWILARLFELVNLSTSKLDSYKLLEPTRAIREFVDDFSTWYLRRSRDRFKSDDALDKKAALDTTRFVLLAISKLIAPFAPFYAEDLYQKVKPAVGPESVHLCDWPEAGNPDERALAAMSLARSFASMAHMQRSSNKIPVRQPLSRLTIKHDGTEPDYWDELREILKDETNVKEVLLITGAGADAKGVELDTIVTPELKREGVARDLIRAIQDLRKSEGLTVGDKVSLILDSDEKGKELVRGFIQDIRRVTLVTGVEHGSLPQKEELAIEEYRFRIGFKR